MLKPVYIICCELSLQDQGTGLHSYINLYEKVLFSRNQSQSTPTATPLIQMRVFAVWAPEAEDENQEFEFEMNVVIPGSDRIVAINNGRITCSTKQGLIRISSHLIGAPPVDGPGIMRLQNRIRHVGSEEWITQEYPIVYEEAVTAIVESVSQAT